MANLVIVESPAKVPTIKGYLGSGYKVVATIGHIRDLPKSSLGVDIENGFEPRYINLRGKSKIINDLRREARAADKVFLATDPDREGEAISWHLATVLDIPLDTPCRVTFNEITKAAVKEAVKHPRTIDLDLVNSQQARRILDRIVGYQLSPFLWKNVKNGLSAGRVQSAATRMVCDREEEIRGFEPTPYWTVSASLLADGKPLDAHYIGAEGGGRLTEEALARQIEAAARAGSFTVVGVKKSLKSRMPAAPFTTSTMQQEASKKLGFQSQKTMKLAQELYEGVNLGSSLGGVQGLITYMRTDSLRISEGARAAAAALIADTWGEDFVPTTPNSYKSKQNAQDAHEAIRPARVELTPDAIAHRLTPDQNKLYRLIWERFVASQMSSAQYNTVTVDLDCGGYRFRAGGYTVKFRGYTVLYDSQTPEELEEIERLAQGTLPSVKRGDVLSAQDVSFACHTTEPPARFNDASLIKIFEESGIGRPSTYATIISTIISREYVKRQGRTLVPTPLGEITTRLMKESFPKIVDYEFTAQMEDQLDGIEHGGTTMQEILGAFYKDFERSLEIAMAKVKKEEIPQEESDILCESCQKKMVYRNGRFGKFLACPNYPTCRNTLTLDANGNPVERAQQKQETATDMKCELCGADVVIRRGRFGEFYACSTYPTCRFTKAIVKDTGVPCPDCGARLVVRRSKDRKVFYSCERYPECSWSTWDMPVNEKCPDCGALLVYKKAKKSIVCSSDACSYSRQEERTVIE